VQAAFEWLVIAWVHRALSSSVPQEQSLIIGRFNIIVGR
jgi:hypothetical protein